MRSRGPDSKVARNALLFFAAFLLAPAAMGCGAESAGRTTTGETTEQKETALEQRMSAREAVGQMFVVGVGGTEVDYYAEKMIWERNVGGVILFGHNMQSERGTRALADALQDLSASTGAGLPLFVAADHEGGEVQHAPWVGSQPSAAEVGRTADPEVARRVALETGRELSRGGVNTDLAPVVDTGSGAAIGTRSYGDDPALVARMGVAAVEGFEEAGVVSAAKHFPNHGPATVDSHAGSPVVDHDLRTVLAGDLAPFRAAIRAGVPMVMLGHLVYPAIDPERPASLSQRAVSLLREELGFDGVIATDDLAMAGARGGAGGEGTTADAALAAVEAGADLLIVSGPPEEAAAAYEAVAAAVETGEIPRERVDASVKRIGIVKDRYLSRGGK